MGNITSWASSGPYAQQAHYSDEHSLQQVVADLRAYAPFQQMLPDHLDAAQVDLSCGWEQGKPQIWVLDNIKNTTYRIPVERDSYLSDVADFLCGKNNRPPSLPAKEKAIFPQAQPQDDDKKILKECFRNWRIHAQSEKMAKISKNFEENVNCLKNAKEKIEELTNQNKALIQEKEEIELKLKLAECDKELAIRHEQDTLSSNFKKDRTIEELEQKLAESEEKLNNFSPSPDPEMIEELRNLQISNEALQEELALAKRDNELAEIAFRNNEQDKIFLFNEYNRLHSDNFKKDRTIEELEQKLAESEEKLNNFSPSPDPEMIEELRNLQISNEALQEELALAKRDNELAEIAFRNNEQDKIALFNECNRLHSELSKFDPSILEKLNWVQAYHADSIKTQADLIEKLTLANLENEYLAEQRDALEDEKRELGWCLAGSSPTTKKEDLEILENIKRSQNNIVIPKRDTTDWSLPPPSRVFLPRLQFEHP